MQSERIEPPWPESVVDALNAYQRAGAMHPFTCGFDSAHVLVATGAGWVCPYDDYTQAWAHRFMTWPEARYSPPEPGRRA